MKKFIGFIAVVGVLLSLSVNSAPIDTAMDETHPRPLSFELDV
ncbi:hypothetical protein [Halobacillus sp. BBL2006]|jgi:hypothetical protein|nr:hypothetical protein [Halobacillus sp. BBL2006]